MKKKSIWELHRLSAQGYEQADKLPLVVILDQVRSLHNIGSVFRTADAFLVEAIYLCGITATPPSAEIHKTALGAEDSVRWHYAEETLSVVTSLRDKGYCVYAVEQVAESISLDKLVLDPTKKYAVVFGNEVKGVQQAVVDECDAAVEIPQLGTKHSLNVSVSAGLVMWDFYKQLYRK